MADLTAYLGDFADDLTDDQRERLESAADTIAERYPVPADGEPADVTDEREAALTSAMQHILGESTPDEVVQAWVAAKRAADEAHAAMTGMLIALSVTETEYRMARTLGLSRTTIRKALAK